MYDDIEFVVACAGQSTRNFPHSKGIVHKSLMPFGDVRLIDHVLKEIVQMGGRHITLVCSNEETINTFKQALARDDKTVEKLRTKNRAEIADILASTFLPEDIDLKFVIQEKPLGTAHVLYCATKVAEGRHMTLIFPDDVYVSKDENNSHLKKLVDDFLQNPYQICVTGVEKEDVSNNSILTNGRLIEKPKNPANHIGGFSPYVFPKEMIKFLKNQWETTPEKILNLGHEWYYVDAINDFLDAGAEAQGFFIKMHLKSPEDVQMDTGALPLYESAELYALLKLSRFKEKNRELARQLLSE